MDRRLRGRRPTLWKLDAMLRQHHGYRRSYDALRRYIRKHFPEFHTKSACIRMEIPPRKLLLDWREELRVQMGVPGGWIMVQALCFSQGFCRKTVVRFSHWKDLESFLAGHQEEFREYVGLPRGNPADCVSHATCHP